MVVNNHNEILWHKLKIQREWVVSLKKPKIGDTRKQPLPKIYQEDEITEYPITPKILKTKCSNCGKEKILVNDEICEECYLKISNEMANQLIRDKEWKDENIPFERRKKPRTLADILAE